MEAVLVNCEYSQVITTALRKKGVVAFSCDILPTEGNPDWHIQGDAIEVMNGGLIRLQSQNVELFKWVGMIAHPPCTRLSNSGVKHLYYGCKKENGIDPLKFRQMEEAAEFYNKIQNAPIKFKAIENPVMHGHARKIVS